MREQGGGCCKDEFLGLTLTKRRQLAFFPVNYFENLVAVPKEPRKLGMSSAGSLEGFFSPMAQSSPQDAPCPRAFLHLTAFST